MGVQNLFWEFPLRFWDLIAQLCNYAFATFDIFALHTANYIKKVRIRFLPEELVWI